VSLPSIYSYDPGTYPKFIGYFGSPTRIGPVNLDEIVSKGNTSIITIREEQEINIWESVTWESYLGKGIAGFSYTNWDEFSSYHYSYTDGEITTLPRFWLKLKEYFHLSEEELQYEKVKHSASRKTRKWGRSNLGGKFYDRMPDFDLILGDLGEVIEVDDSEVGSEIIYYEDTARSKLNTYCVVVDMELKDQSTSIKLLIDRDSDIQVEINCKKKIEDPKKVLIELFENLGLRTSLIESLELTEWYDYHP
jgi:hypothetical protein